MDALSRVDINKIATKVANIFRERDIREMALNLFDMGYLVCLKNQAVTSNPSIFPHGYNDSFRYATLYAIVSEIKELGVNGSLAEVGVYKGNFSRQMHNLLPERKIYLFDTFEGFGEAQVKTENERYNLKTRSEKFSDTNVNDVLSFVKTIMHADEVGEVIVKKGLFPETATGVTDDFALVSLDADLYDPIYAGLEFFYPKLSKNGYIMIHDCRYGPYPGAGSAVRDYCKKTGVPFVPIGDKTTSYIITK